MTIPLDDGWRVTVNEPPAAIDVDLFLQPAFFDLHAPAARAAWYFTLHDARRPRAAAMFLGLSDRAEVASPGRGSYGGFQAVGDLPLERMSQFVDAVDTHLARSGARRSTIVLPPLSHDLDQSSGWANALLRSGYVLTRHELNYHLDLRSPFEAGLDAGNRKRLHKARREGLVAGALDPGEHRRGYDVIADNRAKKGHQLSMGWDALHDMATRLPGRVHVHGVRDGDQLLAASVTLVLNPARWYVFYWGEATGAEGRSPVTLLAAHLCEVARSAGAHMLDLGTSTIEGVPNHGLIRYKRNLGATASLKLHLTRTFA